MLRIPGFLSGKVLIVDELGPRLIYYIFFYRENILDFSAQTLLLTFVSLSILKFAFELLLSMANRNYYLDKENAH